MPKFTPRTGMPVEMDADGPKQPSCRGAVRVAGHSGAATYRAGARHRPGRGRPISDGRRRENGNGPPSLPAAEAGRLVNRDRARLDSELVSGSRLARRSCGMVNVLERGRERYGRRAWAEAYRDLSGADQATALAADDLERLATAAYLTGRDLEFQRIL